jgi:hypothetical protein
MAMFEVLEPESQLEPSMNITPRQKMLRVPIKRRYSNGTSNPEDEPVLSAMDSVSILSWSAGKLLALISISGVGPRTAHLSGLFAK